ncbi:hypothetical protein SAMN05216390_1521, partial [Lachnospiraceae bacterium KH1T2]
MVRKNNMNYFHPPIIKKISFIVNLKRKDEKKMKNIELTKRDRLRLVVTGVLFGFAVISMLPKYKNVDCEGVEAIYIDSHGIPFDEEAYYEEMAREIAEQNAESNVPQNTTSNATSSTQPASTTSTTQVAKQTTKTEQKKPAYTEAEIDAAWSETNRTEATCAVDGKITYKNSLTGKTKTEAIPATGEHSYEEADKVEATCTKEGTVTHTCTVCG